MAVKIDLQKCTGCYQCVIVCPNACFSVVDGKAHVNNKDCLSCRICKQACEHDAIIVIPGQTLGGGY